MQENQEATPVEETAQDAVLVVEEGPTKDLMQTIKNSGIVPTIGSRIAQQMAVFFQAADEYRATSDSIVINSIDEVDKMKLADEVRLTIKRKRLSAASLIKSERDNLKVKMADDILHDKLLLHIGKMIEATMGNIESALEQKSKYRELYEAQVREERSVARTPIFGELGLDVPSFDYLGMTDVEFDLWITGVRKAKEDADRAAKEEQEKFQKLEQERLEKERAEKEQFDARVKSLVEAGLVYDGQSFFIKDKLAASATDVRLADEEQFNTLKTNWEGAILLAAKVDARIKAIATLADVQSEGGEMQITSLTELQSVKTNVQVISTATDALFDEMLIRFNEVLIANNKFLAEQAELKRQEEIKAAEERARKQEQDRLVAEAERYRAAKEKGRKEAEEKAKAEEEAARKKALLAPDKDKFFEFSKKIESLALELPASQSEEAQKLSVEVDGLLKKVVAYINSTASKF